MAKQLGFGHIALVMVTALSLASCGGPVMNSSQANDIMTDSNLTGDAPAPLPDNVGADLNMSALPTPVASSSPMPGSCEAEIGRASAQTLVKQCLQVSGATHPPCNAANSCAVIRDEIQRNCNGSLPGDRPSACKTIQASIEQAADTIRRYYDAIGDHEYASAYALWGNDGKTSGQTLKQFRDGFASTKSTRVLVGKPGDPEGAAGSTYVTIPVVVESSLKDGTKQRFAGTYTLRRVNDVSGATAKQLTWHIYSAKLSPFEDAMKAMAKTSKS